MSKTFRDRLIQMIDGVSDPTQKWIYDLSVAELLNEVLVMFDEAMEFEESCETCDAGGYTCRVHYGDPAAGPHESTYACGDCVKAKVEEMFGRYGEVKITVLPGKTALIPQLDFHGQFDYVEFVGSTPAEPVLFPWPVDDEPAGSLTGYAGRPT